jgi:hypothetical protein
MLATYRGQAVPLVVVAVVVFVPLGLLDALDDTLESADLEDLGELAALGVAAATLLHQTTALLGEVFFAGVVAVIVSEARGDRHRSIGELIRSIRYGRLIAIDLLFAAVVSIGFVLLVVPGILLATWLALAPAAAELEHRGVLDSFRRSRALVHGRFWTVFWVLIPVSVAGDALSTAAQSGSLSALGKTFVGDWVGSVLAGLLVSPLYAVAVVVLFYELRDRKRRAGEGHGASAPRNAAVIGPVSK